MKRAFITDVHYRMGLAAVRSIGRRSIDVTALDYDTVPQKSILGFYSRYASDKRLVPSASENKLEFINGIINLAEESKRNSTKSRRNSAERKRESIIDAHDAQEKPVLIAVGIDSLKAVSEYSSLLEPHFDFVVPSLESMEIADDKQKLMDVAIKTGIPCPETTVLLANETIEQLSERIKYPVVIKYRKGEALKLKPVKRYRIIEDRQTFIEVYKQMHSMQEFPLVQEYIRGDGFGVSAVFDKRGEPLEIFCHKRLREYPVTGGPSCFCESIWDDRLVDYAIRLLKELDWRGVAMVEFKGSLDEGVSLMEINPRFWGSLPLSILSGCDIPFAIYRAASGELYGEHTGSDGAGIRKCGYKQGTRMRFLFQDLLSLPGYMRVKKNKLKFLLQFTGQLLDPRIKDGVLELNDLRPSLAYIRQVVRKL